MLALEAASPVKGTRQGSLGQQTPAEDMASSRHAEVRRYSAAGTSGARGNDDTAGASM